jgi:hypothetical protein
MPWSGILGKYPILGSLSVRGVGEADPRIHPRQGWVRLGGLADPPPKSRVDPRIHLTPGLAERGGSAHPPHARASRARWIRQSTSPGS